jgi:trimeric autotransporter adhesin
MAQDFRAAFAVGESETGITTIDADGVALAAIQGLNEKLEVRSQKSETSIQELKAENAELKARLDRLEQLINTRDGGAKTK